MRPVSKIMIDLIQSVGASGVQLCITLIATPIMTRLYDPTAYAAFGIINNLATTMVGIGLLSLPNAYPLEKDASQRDALLQTMQRILMGLVGLAVIGALGMGIMHRSDYTIAALTFFPVLVLTFGIRQITMSIATLHANFKRISLGQVIEPACSRIGSIGLGALFGSHPAFILGAVAAGNIAAAKIIGKTLWHRDVHPAQPRTSLLATLRRYSDFVIFNTASSQVQPLVMLAVQVTIVAAFSAHDAGQYILAVSILTLPASMIGFATARVVYRHFIEIEQTDPQQLTRHLLRAVFLYLMIGMLILSPIYFFGETIFTIAFSKVWTQAGAIASSLSIAYVGTFALNGVQSIFRVTRRLRLQCMLEVISGAIMLATVALSFHSLTFATAMHVLAVLWLLRNGLMLAACIAIAYTDKK